MNEALIWVPLAVMTAVTVAGMVLISEYYHVKTVPRLFWLRFMSFLVAGGAALFVEWPRSVAFYQCVAALSVLICAVDILYYRSARDNGAGPTSRIEPLSVMLTFVAWSFLMPGQLQAYLDKPLVTAGIAACFAMAAFCATQLRHSPVSFDTFKKLLPVIVALVGVNMLGKAAMDAALAAGAGRMDAAIAYLAVQSALLSLCYGAMLVLWPGRTGSPRPTRPLMVSAGLMMLCSVLHIIPKNIAYTYVPNPAYVTVIGLTAPLFVSAFYRLAGRRDDAAVWAGFGIVASAMALVVLTRF